MEGSTAARLDTQSPMMTEPTDMRSSAFAVASAADVAPVGVSIGANSKLVLERSVRQRSRPVKGRSCGAHVVAQLQNAPNITPAYISPSQGRDSQAVCAVENCTPPELVRTTSQTEGCESGTASAQQHPSGQTTIFSDRGKAIAQFVPVCSTIGRRPRRASAGAAMVASFLPAGTPEMPKSVGQLFGSSVSMLPGCASSGAHHEKSENHHSNRAVCAPGDPHVTQPTQVLLAQLQSHMDEIMTRDSKGNPMHREENDTCKVAAALSPRGNAEPHSPPGDQHMSEELCHNGRMQAAKGTVSLAMSDAPQTEADKAQMSPSAPMCKTQDVPSQRAGYQQPAESQGVRRRLGTAAGSAGATRVDLHSPDQAQRPQHAEDMPLSVKSDHAVCLDVPSSPVAADQSLCIKPVAASQARSSSIHRHSAGQRAAALCLSPGNSKDTANESAAHSTGGGSLQTVIEGDQDHKDKVHAATVHCGDSAEDETTSPAMTPPPQPSAMPSGVPVFSHKWSRTRGRGEVMCAAAVAASASLQCGDNQTSSAPSHVDTAAPRELSVAAVVEQHDGNSLEGTAACIQRPSCEVNDGVISLRSAVRDVQSEEKHMHAVSDPAVAQGVGTCGVQTKLDAPDGAQDQISTAEHLCTGGPDNSARAEALKVRVAQSTPPLLAANNNALNVQPDPVASEEGCTLQRDQSSHGRGAANPLPEVAPSDRLRTEDVCMQTVGTDEAITVAVAQNQPPSNKGDMDRSCVEYAVDEDVSQQIARFSLKRRKTSLSPVADVPSGSLRGALEDALIVHGDRGTKRARVSAGMMAVSATQVAPDQGYFAAAPIDGADVFPDAQPALQKSSTGLRQLVTGSSKGLKVVAAAAANARLTSHVSKVSAGEAEVEQSESPCTGPSNRGSLDDVADGDSLAHVAAQVLSTTQPSCRQHAKDNKSKHVCDGPVLAASLESPLKLPRIVTRSAKPQVVSTAPDDPAPSGVRSATVTSTGDAPSEGKNEAEDSPQTQSLSRSLTSPAFSNGSKSQSKSQCLHDPVSAVLADATSAFLFESDHVGHRNGGAGTRTHAVRPAEHPRRVPDRIKCDVDVPFNPASCDHTSHKASGCAAAQGCYGTTHASDGTPQLQQRTASCEDAVGSDASFAGISSAADGVRASASARVSVRFDGEWPAAECLHSTSPLGRCSLPPMFTEDDSAPATTVQPALTGCAHASPPHCHQRDPSVAEDSRGVTSHKRQSSSPDASAENVAPCGTRAADSRGKHEDVTAEGCTEGRNPSPPVAFGPSVLCSVPCSVNHAPERGADNGAHEDCSHGTIGAHEAIPDTLTASPGSSGPAVATAQQCEEEPLACESPLLTPPRASLDHPPHRELERSLNPAEGNVGTTMLSSWRESPPASPVSRPLSHEYVHNEHVCDRAYEAQSPCTSEASEGAADAVHGSPNLQAALSPNSLSGCEHDVAGARMDTASMPNQIVLDATESPPDEQQCSPPKLPSCLPLICRSDHEHSDSNARHTCHDRTKHQCPEKSATDESTQHGTRQTASDNDSTHHSMEQCSTAGVAGDSCAGALCVERSMPSIAAADCEQLINEGPDPSAVLLSEHPPGVCSPCEVREEDSLNPTIGNPAEAHQSPTRTPPPASSLGGHKMLRGTRGQLLLAAAVSSGGTPPGAQPSGTPPLMNSERRGAHLDNTAQAAHRLGSPQNHVLSDTLRQNSPSRNHALSSPLRHPKQMSALHTTMQTQSPPTACEQGTPPIDAKHSCKAGSTGMHSPVSPMTGTAQALMHLRGSRRHAPTSTVLGATPRGPQNERASEDCWVLGAGGTSTPPHHVQKRRVTVKRRGLPGATSVLGVSATQMCARNASGSAMSLVPGARRRPGAGRLMSAAAAAVPALAALRTAFLDLQLATEASRGADWATLTSTGVPLPDPLDISAMSAQLAMHAAAAAASSAATEIATAMDEARAEWLHLRESRIACWLRLSLHGPVSSSPQPAKLHSTDDAPPDSLMDPAPSPSPVRVSHAQHASQRRSSLKRSPLPRMCVVPQPLPEAPRACMDTSTTPSGASPGVKVTAGCIGTDVATHTTPPLPLFQNAPGAEDTAATSQPGVSQGNEVPVEPSALKLWSDGDMDAQDGCTGVHKRRRSVRFSEQAIVKRYEGKHEPSRVRGEPEVMQAVAVHSPVKCQVAARKERRGWATGSRAPSIVAGDGNLLSPAREDDELEEGEVVESRPGSSLSVEASAKGTGNSNRGILACVTDGNVENESPVSGMLKFGGSCGSGVLGGTSCMVGNAQERHSLNAMTVTVQPHNSVGETISDDEGPPGDLRGQSSSVLVGTGL